MDKRTMTEGGGPAISNYGGFSGSAQTIPLRDWFAGQALPAIIAAYVEANGRCIGTDHIRPNCAAHAYKFADAMLAARKAKP